MQAAGSLRKGEVATAGPRAAAVDGCFTRRLRQTAGFRFVGRLLSTQQECHVAEVVTDNGDHKTKTLAWLGEKDIRIYIAARRDKRKRH